MRVLLVVETDRTRRWIADLARDLVDLGFAVRTRATPATPRPPLVELTLELDRMISGAHRHRGHEAVRIDEIAPPAEADFAPDTVIDLTGDPKPVAGAFSLAPAFDDGWGEGPAIGALTAATPPTIAVVDLADGTVLERGWPSLETASGLAEGLAAVTARANRLLVARLAARAEGRERPRLLGERFVAGPAARLHFGGFATATLYRLAREIYRLACRTPHWRVGWRRIEGPGLLDGAGFAGPRFRPMADPGVRFRADPHPLVVDGRTWVLVEDYDHRVGRGMISAVPFGDEGPSGPAIPAISEPWHLSSPVPILVDGVLHVMPESTERRDVGLYRCIDFPHRWERVATLVSDVVLSDATIVDHGGRWWMFAASEDGRGGWSDMASIRSAPHVLGPWTVHRDDPVFVDARAARSAGQPFHRDGRLFRPVQDCSRVYGEAIHVVEVTRLDEGGYAHERRFTLRPGRHWPGGRLHTVNRIGTLELIDGVRIRPKWNALDALVEPWFEPGDPS